MIAKRYVNRYLRRALEQREPRRMVRRSGTAPDNHPPTTVDACFILVKKLNQANLLCRRNIPQPARGTAMGAVGCRHHG